MNVSAKLTSVPEQQVFADHVTIRGRRINFEDLVNPKLFDIRYIEELKMEMNSARPFRHIVVVDWFNPVLLELVREEFDLIDRRQWKLVESDNERIHRSAPHQRFGPASMLYFGQVNSGWFVNLLSNLTEVEDLISDPHLLGGGLHETREGGTFGIHRDFDRHLRYGFDNKMVFLTYLNRNWDPAWGASLELWSDKPKPEKVREVRPEFGKSILLVHGPDSFHGHPAPMKAPAGITRRSVGSYYYQNRNAVQQRTGRTSSFFLFAHRSVKVRRIVSRLMPPLIVDAIKKIVAMK